MNSKNATLELPTYLPGTNELIIHNELIYSLPA